MSTTSTTTLTEKDAPLDVKALSDAEKKELIAADAVSMLSDTTTLAPNTLSFTPVRSLDVAARGIDVLRLPAPPKELEIFIYDKKDGSVAYQSTRAKRSSGNAVLTNKDGKHLIATEYFWGPTRDPVLHILEDGDLERKNSDVKTTSKWTSRIHTFVLPDGRQLMWEYKREKGFGGPDKKGTALVMTLQGKRIAALIRNAETRTLGSKSCTAGNGGELLLGEDVGREGGVGEELVVATCLLMLKKEIDRRRTVQFMIIAMAVTP